MWWEDSIHHEMNIVLIHLSPGLKTQRQWLPWSKGESVSCLDRGKYSTLLLPSVQPCTLQPPKVKVKAILFCPQNSVFSAREKESCYFTLTRSLIKIIYKDLLISFMVSFFVFLEVLCLPCPSKRGFILDSDTFHQGVISEVPLKINAWQQDDLYVHIIAR